MHDWMIPEREYARQEARRGRRHAFERLDSRRTALVVIDMVPFFVEANPHCRDAAGPINRIAGALRAAGGVVAWVLPSSDDPHTDLSVEFYGQEIAAAFRASGGEGPVRARVHDALRTEEADLYVEKSAASAFFPGRCPLPDLLAARDIETVIIVGTVTNVCCEGTARDARTLGYRVIVAGDGCATVSDAMHNASLTTIYRTFGDVRSSGEILGLIAAGR